jgi:predicted ATPase
LPVAAKSALATTGASADVPGSPMPPGGSEFGTIWELRAATSLARLWQAQCRLADARDLLAPVYGRFSEGFATGDLTAARRLVDELGQEF